MILERARHLLYRTRAFEETREWHELAGIEIAPPGLPCTHCPPRIARLRLAETEIG